jgi:hypothetical protein
MRKLLFLACVLMPVSAMAQQGYTTVVTGQPGYYAPPPPPGYGYGDHHFEHYKWNQIHGIDAKIAQLQYQRQCILQAGNPDMLHACYAPPPPPPVVVVQPPRQDPGIVLGVHIH